MALFNIFDITPLTWQGIICAIVAGSMIGLERQILGKPVGIRTSILICLGSYVFVRIVALDTGNIDSTRIIGQIVTGIGFIGAGVMLARDNTVIGVTSAAAIWMLSAIGCSIGKGYYHQGLILSALTVAVLVGVGQLEFRFNILQKGVHAKNGHVFDPSSIYDMNDDNTRKYARRGADKPREE